MKNKIVAILKSIDWKNISVATYVRYILMIIAIINMILTHFGLNPINVSETELYQAVSDIITCVIFVMNTWKNNSVTSNAIAADGYLKDLKTVDEHQSEDGVFWYSIKKVKGIIMIPFTFYHTCNKNSNTWWCWNSCIWNRGYRNPPFSLLHYMFRYHFKRLGIFFLIAFLL